MSSSIITNRVNIEADVTSIDARFDLWKIKTDLISKSDYGIAINTIYSDINPLALSSLGKGQYVALVSKGEPVKLDSEHYSLVKVTAIEVPKITLARLLINFMPRITDKHHRSSEGVGLYYLVNVENIRNVEVLRAFEIKLEWVDNQILLKINGTTFTPVDYHKNKEGDLYADCRHLPRVHFDRWSQELVRSKNGAFLKKKHRDKKMSSELVSLDTKNPGKFWQTKMGVLTYFMRDVEQLLSGLLSIQLQPLDSDYRVRFKESNVKAVYRDIDKLLCERTINIINLTDVDIAPLLMAINNDGLIATVQTSVSAKHLNLAIHHSADYYGSHGKPDPYTALRVDPRVIIQSAYPETLLKQNELCRAAYEACKKELLIKWEVSENRLKLMIPGGNWLFISSEAEGETLNYHTLSCNEDLLHYELKKGNEADSILLELPGVMGKNEVAVINKDTGDAFIFSNTGLLAFPQYKELSDVMEKLNEGYASGLPRVWVEEFLLRMSKDEINVKNPQLVEQKLSCLLDNTRGSTIISKQQLFEDPETKLSYRGSLQTFFDWVMLEKGLMLGASLKSQNAGFIEASLGLFFNAEENLYFVGDKDNINKIPRFCHIRKIITDADEVPVELLKMMEAFHIRHKQATVHPYLFKHLAEYAQRLGLTKNPLMDS